MPLNNDSTFPPNEPHGQSSAPNRAVDGQEEFILAPHVAILDTHPMSPSSDGQTQYCGPKELQMIADNNNRRIDATGDACPIILGHTEDGEKEVEQPPIVGWATNFTVGPLFNTGRQALFADFHIKRKDKDIVNAHPRRSVELWPKRWEVDPISLLGATTPERDLGLLQLRRGDKVVRMSADGRPTRYSRSSEGVYDYLMDEESTMPIFERRPRRYAAEKTPKCGCDDKSCCHCEGKCKSDANSLIHRTDIDDDKGTPMCSGCAQDAISTGIFRCGVSYKKQQPFEPKNEPQNKSRGGRNMAGHSYATPIRYNPTYPPRGAQQPRRYEAGGGMNGSGQMPGVGMDAGGGSPPDEGTASMIEAVLNSAPIQEIIQNSKQTQEQLGEIMQLLQSQAGGEGEQDQGQDGQMPPEGPDAQGGDDQGAPDGGGPDEEARWMHEGHEDPEATAERGAPTQYEDDDYVIDNDGEDDEGDEPHQYEAGFPSSTNTYIPEAGQMGGHRGVRPGKTPVRNSRTGHKKSQWELYEESLRTDGEKLRLSRLEAFNKQQQAQITDLVQTNLKYARAGQLQSLQAVEGIVMDIPQEIADTLHIDDAAFGKHLEKIKVRYKRDPSAIQPIRLADTGAPMAGMGGGPGRGATPPEANMTHEQSVHYSRRLAGQMMRFKRQKPDANDTELAEMARAELNKQPA